MGQDACRWEEELCHDECGLGLSPWFRSPVCRILLGTWAGHQAFLSSGSTCKIEVSPTCIEQLENSM
jgi:hypothetical protein